MTDATRQRAESPPLRAPRATALVRGWRAFRTIVVHDLAALATDRARLAASFARPGLWLIVAAGMQTAFGQLVWEESTTFGSLAEYMAPGLVALILVAEGISAGRFLAGHADGAGLPLLLSAPLPRGLLLAARLVAAALGGTVVALAFLGLAGLAGVFVPWENWPLMLAAIVVAAVALAALGAGLALAFRSVAWIGGAMSFVILPLFVVSSALYPARHFRENEAEVLYWLASANPFTHAVELIRDAAYGTFDGLALAVVVATGVAAFAGLALAYRAGRAPSEPGRTGRWQAGP